MGETRIMAFWTLYLSNGKQVVHGPPPETTDDNSLRNDSGNSQSESKMQHGLEGRWAGKKRRAEFQGGFLGGIHRPTRHPDYIRKSRDAKRYREWHFTLYTLHDCFRIHFHLKAKTAAVLFDVGRDYSVGLANFFKKSFTKQGGQIVDTLNYQSGDQDFTAQLTKIIAGKPDVLFIPSYFAEGAIIMKQARELGAAFKIMGGDAMDNPEITKIGGKAVEGFVHTTFPYDPSMKEMNPAAKKFTEDWKKTYPGKEPNVNAALGYDAARMPDKRGYLSRFNGSRTIAKKA